MITIPDKYGPFLAICIRQFDRTNGGAPRELLDLADELLTVRHAAGRDAAAHARALSAARSRRYRARRRAAQESATVSRIA